MDRFKIRQLNIAERQFEGENIGMFGLKLYELLIEETGLFIESLFIQIKPNAVIDDDLSGAIVDYYIKLIKQSKQDVIISSVNLVYLRDYTNDDLVRIKIRFFAANSFVIDVDGGKLSKLA